MTILCAIAAALAEGPEIEMTIEPASCYAGEEVLVCYVVLDEGDGDLSNSWTQDSSLTACGVDALDEPSAQCTTFVCPADCCTPPGEVMNFYVVVEDVNGHQAWDFNELTIYCPADTGLAGEPGEGKGDCNCASGRTSALFLLAPLLALRRQPGAGP